MERDQLIDLTRRAVKLARDKTTDLAPAEHLVQASEYTSVERHQRDIAMLMASPQLVGYVSELPEPGSYCTKSVMGRSVLLARTSAGSVKAFNWKLAVDTFSENYHFTTVHHLDNVPEDQWDPFQNMVVIYALFPNILLSVTIANGELFRIYPATICCLAATNLGCSIVTSPGRQLWSDNTAISASMTSRQSEWSMASNSFRASSRRPAATNGRMSSTTPAFAAVAASTSISSQSR